MESSSTIVKRVRILTQNAVRSKNHQKTKTSDSSKNSLFFWSAKNMVELEGHHYGIEKINSLLMVKIKTSISLNCAVEFTEVIWVSSIHLGVSRQSGIDHCELSDMAASCHVSTL